MMTALVLAVALLAGSPAAATVFCLSNECVVNMEPDESLVLAANYAPQYGNGVTVSSATKTVTVRKGTDADADDIVTSGPTPAGSMATLRIVPVGRHGVTYQIHVLATLSNGDKAAVNWLVKVATQRPGP